MCLVVRYPIADTHGVLEAKKEHGEAKDCAENIPIHRPEVVHERSSDTHEGFRIPAPISDKALSQKRGRGLQSLSMS